MKGFERMVLQHPVVNRPLDQWPPISALLLGSQTRFVQGARWRHRVIEIGDGPPLIMYHGIGGHAETYARSFASLSKHFHVYAVDALFHGYSDKSGFDVNHSFELMSDGFIDLIDALGYDSVFLEGESMGGTFGTVACFEHPERVRKFVNNAGFYRFTFDKEFPPSKFVSDGNLAELSVKAITEPTKENIRKRLEWLVAKPEHMTAEMVEIRTAMYNDPEINASMRAVANIGGTFGGMVAHFPYTEEDLRRFPVESLVIWGEFNPGDGPEFGEYCAQLMGAKFYEVKGAGHWPQWEKPEEYCQAIIEFLLG